MIKGFIGPIGDDLPSLIAIMLALTLFFSGLTFSMNVLTQRQRRVRVVKGALDISRTLTKEPVLDAQGNNELVDSDEAKVIANNNDLAFNAKYGAGNFTSSDSGYSPYGSVEECGENSLYFSYLVSRNTTSGIKIDTLRICVWEAKP